MTRTNITSIALTVRLGGPSRPVDIVAGREAWALGKLIVAGPKGLTPIDTPAPRWSHYVFLLRQRGIDIETIREPHGGPFPGQHARYVLRSDVTVLSEERAA